MRLGRGRGGGWCLGLVRNYCRSGTVNRLVIALFSKVEGHLGVKKWDRMVF